MVICSYCKGKNHTASYCLLKKQKEAKGEGSSLMETIPKEPSKEGSSSSESNSIDQNRSSKGRRILMYTPAFLNGMKLSKCLVDTGSEVNILPAREATKHGFSVNPGGVQLIRGFNGQTGKVTGSVIVDLKFGPENGVQKAEFIVTPEVAYPILGMPALKQFHFAVDCTS